VLVSCFVYGIEDPPPFVLSRELRDAFWISIADLIAHERHVMVSVRFNEEMHERPAILLPQPGKPVLWGITYRLVMEFLNLDGEATDCSPLEYSVKR
jgi:hypothetical protein